jgi:phosphoserine phosphatase RsbX
VHTGGVVVAVADGLGHGPEAALASTVALDAVATRPHLPALTLMEYCHQCLRSTRGAVLSVASITNDHRMTWVGVGNVAGVLHRAAATMPREETLVPRVGVLGHQLPALSAAMVILEPGDTLALATDGVDAGSIALNACDPPQALAERILSCGWKGIDDGLVVVARYRGNGS